MAEWLNVNAAMSIDPFPLPFVYAINADTEPLLYE
jgi:hypothetical protein